MGHIEGKHIQTLTEKTAPQVAKVFKQLQVDVVLLTPAGGTCHQSIGLIQRIIESNGIPTISISINRPYTEKVKPPRSVFLRWPFGHPLGEPHQIDQQAAVLGQAFKALNTIKTPGEIVNLNWCWRRESYPGAPWLKVPNQCLAS